MSSSASKKEKKKENNLSDETKLEIKTQIEYYLGDENLKKDSFFHGLISSDANGYLNLDYILKCNKIKKKGWTKEDIIQGIELSDFVELDKTKEKVRRKNNLKLPELNLLNQKRKKDKDKEEDKKEEKKENKKKKEEEPKIFDKNDITIFKILSDEITSVSWKTIFAEFKKLNPELNVEYGRFKDNQGHIGVILKEGQNLDNIKLTENFEIEGKKFNVKICQDDDLIDFWKEHGSHYEYCMNQREKHNKTKERKEAKKKKFEFKGVIIDEKAEEEENGGNIEDNDVVENGSDKFIESEKYLLIEILKIQNLKSKKKAKKKKLL